MAIILGAWEVGDEYRDDAYNAVMALRAAGWIRRTGQDDLPAGSAGTLVLAQWDSWQCLVCDCRYSVRLDEHGAPEVCKGRLQPVTVTVTRRSV